MRSVKRNICLNDETLINSKSKKLQPELELNNHEELFCVTLLSYHVYTLMHFQCYNNVIHPPNNCCQANQDFKLPINFQKKPSTTPASNPVAQVSSGAVSPPVAPVYLNL